MNKRHLIEEAVFDISFDSMQAAHEQETELSSFIRERLLPLADEIFGEFSQEGMVFRIDQLEIDLGDINYRCFQDEMESRFREKLKSIMRDKINSLVIPQAGSAPRGAASKPTNLL